MLVKEEDVGLSVKRVEKLIRAGVPGRHTDGPGGVRGLMLCIEGKTSAHWLLRYQRNKVVRHMGLGSARDLPLAAAREKASLERERIARDIDPLELKRKERETRRQAEAKRITFRQVAERYHETHAAGWTSAMYAGEFLASLQRWAYPHIGNLDVSAIGKDEVLRVLEQKLRHGEGTFWVKRAITADRVRNRIERTLDFATVRGFRSGDNPARWRGYLEEALPSPRKVRPVKHLDAVPYDAVPKLMAELDASVGAQALRFTILTAARLGEAVGARWDEFDMEAAEWVIPKERMKSRREHRVPLSEPVLELLRSLYREENNPFLFIGRTPGTAVAQATVLQALRRAGRNETVHGFRSAFRDWCGDRTGFAREVAEAALAHIVGDKAEQAYRRGNALAKRRRLMEQWATFCYTPPAADKTPAEKTGEAEKVVVPIRA
jgi:integrase